VVPGSRVVSARHNNFSYPAMFSAKTIYDPETNMHLATITPPLAAVNIEVRIDTFDDPVVLKELFLYNFDVDSNCIEFAFGEKIQELEGRHQISYATDPAIHVPPFRIQIAHQPATADLSGYAFTVRWELAY
jgi:hypothetical protein